MKEPIIGINLPGGTSLTGLDAALKQIAEDGFDACEINLSSCPLIIGGEFQPRVASYMKEIMERYPLQYTGHTGYGLDLRDLENMKMQRKVMFASIDACQALGIAPLNFHYEEQSMFSKREKAFFDNMRDAADYAQEKGIFINIENIEVEYAYKAADAVRELSHPNVGMTLDLGHLFLSASYFGYDFTKAVSDCAPLVRHVHINDNTGDFEPMRLENLQLYNTLDKGYRFAFGRGDIHIPPFWGKAPLKQGLQILKDAGFCGVWLCEYYSHLFKPFNRQVQQEVREFIRTL